MRPASKACRGIFGIGVTRRVVWDMFRAISSNSVILHMGRAFLASRRISARGRASTANGSISVIRATG